MTKKVAVQGYRGCFHEEAARKFYSCRKQEISIVECPTFQMVFQAMRDGAADAGIMAIENTTSGGLLPNFELLRGSDFKIKGEIYIPIHQNLMALKGQKLEDIKEVRTHYMAINQTRPFFEANCPWIKMVETEDTAKSATEVARKGLKGVGAVASELAAEENGLEILAHGIETYKQNFTRFLIFDDENRQIQPLLHPSSQARLACTSAHDLIFLRDEPYKDTVPANPRTRMGIFFLCGHLLRQL